MSKIEKRFTQDFEDGVKFDKKFDVSQLETNKPRKNKFVRLLPVLIPLTCVVATVIPFAIGAFAMTHKFETRTIIVKRHYNSRDVEIIENNTFRKLNNVTYPMATDFNISLLKEYSSEEKNSYLTFADKVFKKMSHNKNSMYSPITLYSVLNNLSGVTTDLTVDSELNTLLGSNLSSRDSFVKKMIQSNYFSFDGGGTIQLNNAAFLTNEFDPNPSYINRLTSLYCEAFQLDFLNNSDVNQMLDWMKGTMRYENITLDDIGIQQDELDAFVVTSVLYFASEWSVIFDDETVADKFYLSDGTTKDVEYMSHKYLSDNLYEYDDYYTFDDIYSNRTSIEYIVPKDDKTIYDVINNNNIFVDNEANHLQNERSYNEYFVSLSMPEFKIASDLDWKNTMESLDCGTMFQFNVHAFDAVFENIEDPFTTIYLRKLKQKSIVDLNKKGTIIQNYVAAVGGVGATAPIEGDTLEVRLDHPFAYIIKDLNGMPLFAGIVDNPVK